MNQNKEKRFIWLNGEIVPFEEAKIHALSPTCLYGINTFEGIRCYWNDEKGDLYVFRLKEHLSRLIESIKIIRLDAKYTDEELQQGVFDVLRKTNVREDVYIRQTVFLDGFGSWYATGPVGMCIMMSPRGRAFEGREGINCCISSWERINDKSFPPRAKVGSNYLNSRLAQIEAVENGYDSAILMNNQGKIAEGPGSCIFIVRDNKLITPMVTSSILESITRNTIIELANNELKIPVIERDIDRTELYITQEAFLCGSAMEIVSIISVDRLSISSGNSGIITNKLKELYFDVVRGKNDKYKKWLTPAF